MEGIEGGTAGQRTMDSSPRDGDGDGDECCRRRCRRPSVPGGVQKRASASAAASFESRRSPHRGDSAVSPSVKYRLEEKANCGDWEGESTRSREGSHKDIRISASKGEGE